MNDVGRRVYQHAPNPERDATGLFHEGDVAAIAAAAKGALLVFIPAMTRRAPRGPRPGRLERRWRHAEIGGWREGWVALWLAEADEPRIFALCLRVMRPSPSPWTRARARSARRAAPTERTSWRASPKISGGARATEAADDGGARAARRRGRPQTPPRDATASQPAPATHEPPAQPAPAPRTDDPPQDETSRDETSRDASSAAADADAIFAKAKAEAELNAARAEMAARIKADAALKRAAAIEERAKKAAEAEKRREDEAKRAAEDRERRTVEARERLGVAARIQLPDGTSVTARLPAGATIGDVRGFLVAEAPEVDWGNMDIWNAWPRRVVDESDPTRTVAEDLGLGARPSLLAIHRVGGDGGLSVTHRAGPGGRQALLGILRKIGRRVLVPGDGPPAARRAAAAVRVEAGRAEGRRGRRIEPGAGSGGGGEAIRARRDGNVHTLGGLRDDVDEGDDGRNRFWNGNSTQFGGGPADADAGDAPMDGFYTSKNE